MQCPFPERYRQMESETKRGERKNCKKQREMARQIERGNDTERERETEIKREREREARPSLLLSPIRTLAP